MTDTEDPFTTEEIREIFIDRDLEDWAKKHPEHRNASGEEFDLWLAAHDAEVRAASQQPAPEDVREDLEEWSFEHRPILSMRDGCIASCKCLDRVFFKDREDWDSHITDAILARFDVRRKP